MKDAFPEQTCCQKIGWGLHKQQGTLSIGPIDYAYHPIGLGEPKRLIFQKLSAASVFVGMPGRFGLHI